MSYRRRMRTSNNGGEDTLEAIGQVLLLCLIILGAFGAPVLLWHLNDSFSKQLQTPTTHPSLMQYK